jgi:hypothetical protein
MTSSPSVIDPHDRIISRLKTSGSNQLSRDAAHAYGHINSWYTGPNVRSFNLEDIGRACSRAGFGRLDGNSVFDHPIYYHNDGRCAAVVYQPYAHAYGLMAAEAKRLAKLHQLALHVPPFPLMSLWVPDKTAFFVFCEPGHQIEWLPEQITGIGEQPPVIKLDRSPSIVPATGVM